MSWQWRPRCSQHWGADVRAPLWSVCRGAFDIDPGVARSALRSFHTGFLGVTSLHPCWRSPSLTPSPAIDSQCSLNSMPGEFRQATKKRSLPHNGSESPQRLKDLHAFYIFTLDMLEGVSCSSGWPQSHYIAQDLLQPAILLLHPPSAGVTGVHQQHLAFLIHSLG